MTVVRKSFGNRSEYGNPAAPYKGNSIAVRQPTGSRPEINNQPSDGTHGSACGCLPTDAGSKITLTDHQLNQLADHIAERLQMAANGLQSSRNPQVANQNLVDASTLAQLLGVSRATIYEHSAELGAIEVGSGGKRPRLRFDVETARQAWNVRSRSEGSQTPQSLVATGVSRRRRRSQSGAGARMVPVRGRK